MTKANSYNLFRDSWFQVLATVSGTLIAISDGMTYGWTSPMIPYLTSEESHIPMIKHEAEWLETIALLGAFCGLPFTILFTSTIGRKMSMQIAACSGLLAWTLITFGNNIIYLYVGRFFAGMAGDMCFVAAPMYIAEIAAQRIRGFLSSIIYLMMLLGVLICYCIGPYAPFFVVPSIGIALSLAQLLIFSFMPESPYFYLIKNKPEKAEASLRKFRGDSDIDKELKEMTVAIERQNTEKGRPQDLILVPSNRKAILIMTVLNGAQPFAGISVMLMNLHLILEAAGSIYIESAMAAIMFAVIMTVAATSASLFIDRFGRRILLLSSGIVTTICLATMAVYYHLKFLGYDVLNVSWIPAAMVMIYAAGFKCGMGLVPIVVTAEIFPAKMKAIGMTVADVMWVVFGILSIQIYQQLTDALGIHVPFYFFAACAFFSVAFTYFYIPETKGKTLEEIQMILKGEKLQTDGPN